MKEDTLDHAAIGRRIRQLRNESLGLSQEAFAALLGVTRGAVGNWELGKGIKFENLTKIAMILDQPVEWIATGRGDGPIGDFRQSTTKDKSPAKMQLVSSYDPDFDKKAYNREYWSPSTPGAIPEIDVKLGAGQGAIGEVISLEHGGERIAGHRVIAEWVMPDDFVTQELGSSRKSTVVMEVIGDSMSPTYLPGDRVVVDLSQTDHVSDTVYAISDGASEPQIKRLQRVPFSNPARVKIISDNPALETFEVDLERVQIIGRICGHLARR